MAVSKYTGTVTGNSMNASDMYVVTMSAGAAVTPSRSFVGNLNSYMWNSEIKPCLYVGDNQGNRIAEATNNNGPVIEGNHKNYMTSGPFETDHSFNQFTGKCSV